MEVTANSVLVIDTDIKRSYSIIKLLRSSQLFNNIVTVPSLEEALFLVQRDQEEKELNINLIFLSLEITTPDQFALAMHLKLLSKEYNKDLIIAGIEAENPSISKITCVDHVFKAPILLRNLEMLDSMLK